MIVISHRNLYDILVFVEDYYDVPLKGTCNYKGKIAKFRRMSTKKDFYEITELSIFGRIGAKLNQWLFEICVGTHWSYKDGKKRGDFGGFTPLTRLYYWIKGH